MHAAEDRKSCIQDAALQMKKPAADRKKGTAAKTSAIIINSGFTNVKKKSILYMFGQILRPCARQAFSERKVPYHAVTGVEPAWTDNYLKIYESGSLE